MHNPVSHVSALELDQGLADVIASPSETGRLEFIFVRPTKNERQSVASAELTLEGGIDGDRWASDSFYRLNDGRSDPRCQVSIMNSRLLRQIAGEESAMCLAGDNLIVDLDLSEANLPAGSRLAIGGEVVLEISELPHTGCSKFEARYGAEARSFVNNKQGKSLHLRGRYTQIIRGGTIRVGDAVRV